jgi:acyl dehydratase
MTTRTSPPDAGRPLFFEDLSVGMRFVSRPHQLDEQQVVAFARQFDPQPFHLDSDAATHTMLAGLAASGWHTAAVSMRLFLESGLTIAGGVLGAGGEISWPTPTRPDDAIHVECDIVGVRPSRSRLDRGIVKFRNETLNQRREIVQIFSGTLIVPRRP